MKYTKIKQIKQMKSTENTMTYFGVGKNDNINHKPQWLGVGRG